MTHTLVATGYLNGNSKDGYILEESEDSNILFDEIRSEFELDGALVRVTGTITGGFYHREYRCHYISLNVTEILVIDAPKEKQ